MVLIIYGDCEEDVGLENPLLFTEVDVVLYKKFLSCSICLLTGSTISCF